MKNIKKHFFIVLIIFLVLVIVAMLYYFGILQINNPSKNKFPIKGVDVSSYQGDIDWDTLSKNDIHFAFIKATEGSSYVDSKFEENLKSALDTNLKIGAYHFFSYDSTGIAQAEHFIKNVPKNSLMLPPVIDVEFYGDKEINLPNSDDVYKELGDMIVKLRDYYGVEPIIYATEKSYEVYIKDNFNNSRLWIRSVYGSPKYISENEWVFWQYSNRTVLKGYKGDERYIDMNVFNGTYEELEFLNQKQSN